MANSARFKWPWQRKKPKASPHVEIAAPAPAPKPVPTAQRRVEPRGIALPKFRTTAADHFDRGRPDPRSRERVRLRQTFTPAQPVLDPRMFAGRRDVLESIIRAVEDQKSHVVIFGDRGVGKTSLLHMLSQAAAEANYIFVYFSCGATSDFSETFRAVAAEVPLLYHSAMSPISSSNETGSTLADLLGPGKLTPRLFGDAAAKLVGTRVLVILDEFDRAESAEFRRDIAELIKTLSDVSARLQLIIAGVASDLADLIEHIPSIRRSISALRVSAMSDDEIRGLIDNGAQMSGIKFDARAADLVVSGARGSPYLTSLLCHLGGIIALDDGRANVEANDIAEALEEAIEEFKGRLPIELVQRLDQAGNEPEAPIAGLNATLEELKRASDGVSGKRTISKATASSHVLERLAKEGMLQTSKPAAYALVLDSLAPYLQLKSAREKFLKEAA